MLTVRSPHPYTLITVVDPETGHYVTRRVPNPRISRAAVVDLAIGAIGLVIVSFTWAIVILAIVRAW